MPASAVGPFRSAARYAPGLAQAGPAVAAGQGTDDIFAMMLTTLDADQRRRLAEMVV